MQFIYLFYYCYLGVKVTSGVYVLFTISLNVHPNKRLKYVDAVTLFRYSLQCNINFSAYVTYMYLSCSNAIALWIAYKTLGKNEIRTTFDSFTQAIDGCSWQMYEKRWNSVRITYNWCKGGAWETLEDVCAWMSTLVTVSLAFVTLGVEYASVWITYAYCMRAYE